MPTVKKSVTIDFGSGDQNIDEWAEKSGLDLSVEALADLTIDVKFNYTDFDDDALYGFVDDMTRANLCHDEFVADADDIRRIYRMMADGDLAAAMDEMHRAFDFLRAPSHEQTVLNLIAAGNARHG